MYSQSGSVFEGLATTKPAPAPGTLDPSGPMLFRAPCKAIALSDATNELRSRDLSSLGAANARPARREVKPTKVVKGIYMVGEV
jgi:hypothetical protein